MSDDPPGQPPGEHPGKRLFAYREAQRAQDRSAGAGPNNVTPLDPQRHSRYVRRALEAEVGEVARAPQGQRNHTLNAAAFNLGQLVAAHALPEPDVRAALLHAASTAGLTRGESEKTITSGLTAGMQHPRLIADDGGYTPGPASSPDAPFGLITPTTAGPPPPPPPPGAGELHDFWDSREVLAHLYAFARARRVSPWAVLGVTLARVITCTRPTVVLPPIVGAQASLNTFIGLVGRSGSGKGAAERCAAEALHLPHITTMQTGSGEGLVHAYRRRTRSGELEVVNTAVLFSVPEIDTLSALGARQGATLMPVLRNAWSGERLGFAYADPSRRLDVEEHSYRLCLVAGIQPSRADTLLKDADGGTPQRFLWLPGTDPHAPATSPALPKARTWPEPNWNRGDLRNEYGHGRMELPVCNLARTTIDAAALARLRGETEALDGHLLLCQLKTAAALALLEGRLEVRDDDWQLAATIIGLSSAVRTSIQQTLREGARAKNVAQALAEAERVEVVAEHASETARKRVIRTILRKLNTGPMAHSKLRDTIAHRDRKAFPEAIDLLLETGQITTEEVPHGVHYHLAR